MMLRRSVVFFLLFMLGCSVTKISSRNGIPLEFGPKAKQDKEIELVVHRDFYLWGLIPAYHEIEIDRELGEKGVDALSELNVETRNSFSDYVWTLVTFGFYFPRTYIVRGKTYMR